MSEGTNSLKYQANERAKKICEGNWFYQLSLVSQMGGGCNVYTGACARRPLKRMVAKAFLYPVREGMDLCSLLKAL